MAIPPVTLNLLQLLPGDDQQVHTDKINFNFDQILSLGGGPPGLQGITGIQGVPGSQGVQGFTGDAGAPGSKWYVQGTVPALSPSPNVGDFWFDTSTLDIYEWTGSTWNLIGTLTVAGVFKESTGDTDRVVFTNTTPLKSMVLSPIDYGVGAPTAGAYKLKLIGTSGTNIMNFGVVESGNESPSALQSYITMSTIVPSSEYSFGLVNPAGHINFSAPGTSLKLTPQASGTSKFEFNGTSLQVQINANERNLGFSPAAESGLGFHIGLQDALTVAASRGLSIIDQAGFSGFFPMVSLRGASSDPLTSDGTIYAGGIFMDAKHPQLSDPSASSDQLWWRYRTNVGGGQKAFVGLATRRTFDDPGNGTNPGRSTAMELVSGIDSTAWHKIGFFGGAKDATEGTRPQVRITPPTAGNLLAVDTNGYVGLGTAGFIQDSNSDALASNQFHTLINIEGPTSGVSEGGTVFGGIHFVPDNAGGSSDRIMGLTAGVSDTFSLGTALQSTHASILFKRSGGTQKLGIEFGTGSSGIPFGGATPGSKTRMSIDADGIINMHGRRNKAQTANRNYKLVYDLDNGASTTLEGVGKIYAYDTLADAGTGMYKDIILQPFTDTKIDSVATTFRGGGFVGIGDMTSFTHQKPQTKLHVKGAVTFGSRQTITDYATNVGTADNWTFGSSHINNATNSVILGGLNQSITTPVANAVIIGSTSVGGAVLDSSLQDNMVVIPSFVYISTEAWKTSSEFQDPRKGGIYETAYTGANNTSFGANTLDEGAAFRVHYNKRTNSPGLRASNGVDIIGNYTVVAAKIGGPNFTPPEGRGYFLQCINHSFNISHSEECAFIVDGYNRVAIGAYPMYKPNDSNYLDTDPTTWPTITGDGRWLDLFASLQVNGTAGLNGNTASMSLLNGFSTSSTIANNRALRNAPTTTTAAFGSETVWITTPNHSATASNKTMGILAISPGLYYANTASAAARIHGASTYIKGGDVGSISAATGVLRGGDVVIHGGKAWDSQDKTSYRADTLNNSASADQGYGNVSLAYDWDAGQQGGSVSIGVGTPVMSQYVGRFTITRTSSTAGTVSNLIGKDFRGQAFTASTPSGSASTLNVTITFPTAMATSNIACVSSIDSTDNNDYRYQLICNGRTTTSVTFSLVWVDDIYKNSGGTSWGNGTGTTISFAVYCLPN